MVGIGSQWCPHGAHEQVHTANDRSKHTLRADRAQVWSISLTFWSSAGPHSNLYACEVCAKAWERKLRSLLRSVPTVGSLPSSLTPAHSNCTNKLALPLPAVPHSHSRTQKARGGAGCRGARFLLGGADSCGESAWQERGGLKEMKDAKIKNKQTKN